MEESNSTYLLSLGLRCREQVAEGGAEAARGVQQAVAGVVLHERRDHAHAARHLGQVAGDGGDGGAHRRVVHLLRRPWGPQVALEAAM